MSKRNKARSFGYISMVLLIAMMLSAVLSACAGQKAGYQELTKPDRIRAVLDGQEQTFTEKDPEYSAIYEALKKNWDAARDSSGLFEMIQLAFLEKESVPEDASRIVFEYDTPIRWRIALDNESSEKEMNTYIFFLSQDWELEAAVVCKDGDYEAGAFFPAMEIPGSQLLEVLKK